MDSVTLITLILGIWGTILSTILAILKITERSISLEVTTNKGLTRHYNAVRDTLSIEGVNKGKRPIKINGYGFLLPNDKVLYLDPLYVEPKLPTLLEDGESVCILLDIVEISKGLMQEGYKGSIKVKGFLTTPSKKKKIMSEPINIKIDRWLKKK